MVGNAIKPKTSPLFERERIPRQESKKPRMEPTFSSENILPMSDLRKFDMVGKRLDHYKKISDTKGKKHNLEKDVKN